MRIVHVIGSMNPKTGGPPMVVGRLAAAQVQLGFDVRIVTYAGDDHVQAIQTCKQTIPDFEKITLACVDQPNKKEHYTARQAYQMVCQHIKNTHDAVVHLHGVWEPIIKQSALACLSLKVPYIIAPHGMLHPWSLSQSKWKKKIALLLGYRKMLTHATAIHALNRDEVQYIDKLRLSIPCFAMPNGVFMDEILPLPEPGYFVQNHQALQGKPYILFLSRIHYKKGLDRLADAFAKIACEHKSVQLVIAGPDDGGEKSRFENQIKELGIASRVHLTGPLWDQEKYAAMQDAACFCLPSRQEGFSVAITEALAVGVPVVISKACCFDEVADSGAGIVVELEDSNHQASTQQLVDALLEILDHAPNDAMRKAGQQLVQSRYTWPVIAKQSLGIYDQMIGATNA